MLYYICSPVRVVPQRYLIKYPPPQQCHFKLWVTFSYFPLRYLCYQQHNWTHVKLVDR